MTFKIGMYDTDLVLKEAFTLATASNATAICVGDGLVGGNMIVDVSAIEIASNTELYTIMLQGGSTSTFTSYATLAILELGANEVLDGNVDSAVGRYVVPFRNERNGVTYPYLRASFDVAGDIASGATVTVSLTTR